MTYSDGRVLILVSYLTLSTLAIAFEGLVFVFSEYFQSVVGLVGSSGPCGCAGPAEPRRRVTTGDCTYSTVYEGALIRIRRNQLRCWIWLTLEH